MDAEVKRCIANIVKHNVKWDSPLCDYTSFRIGGPADAVIIVENLDELERLFQLFLKSSVKWSVIGRGTNLLVKDEGFNGAAIILKGEFEKYTIREDDSEVQIDVGAGFGLSRLSSVCVEKGFSGLEFAMGIPGTIGGAVIMNAGAWGSEISDAIVSVDILTEKGLERINREAMDFSYRNNRSLADFVGVVTSSIFRLKKGNVGEISAVCSRYRKLRDEKQPKGLANAGSIFKNPEGDSAGRLIEASGLKGKKIGDAGVSVKHANFIVNHGKATAEDVLALMKHIQSKVMSDSGISLVPEVHVL